MTGVIIKNNRGYKIRTITKHATGVAALRLKLFEKITNLPLRACNEVQPSKDALFIAEPRASWVPKTCTFCDRSNCEKALRAILRHIARADLLYMASCDGLFLSQT